ncbi:unnamed protein product, partial [Symbiodinium pilosum]
QKYLTERGALMTLCHLISAEQRGKLSTGDRQVLNIFQRSKADRQMQCLAPVRYVPVLTKTDLFESEEVEGFRQALGQTLSTLKQPSDVIACTSMSPEGIEGFQDVVGEAARRGWDSLDEWISDAQRMSRPPSGRNKVDRRQVKQAYTSTAKRSANRPARGGKGARTFLPPRV